MTDFEKIAEASRAFTEQPKQTGEGKKTGSKSSLPNKETQKKAIELVKSIIAKAGKNIASEYIDGEDCIIIPDVCLMNDDHQDGGAHIKIFSDGAISYYCHHDGCKSMNVSWQMVRQKYDPDYHPVDLEQLSDEAIAEMSENDLINAVEIVMQIKDQKQRGEKKAKLLARARVFRCTADIRELFKSYKKAEKKSGADDCFFDEDGNMLYSAIGNYLIKHNGVCIINGTVHIYVDGVYKPDIKTISGEIIKLIENTTQRQRKEILAYLEENPFTPHKEVAPAHLIPFRDSIYNIYTDEFIPYSPEYVFLNRFPVQYNPEAPDDAEIMDTLHKLANKDTQIFRALLQSLGYIFFRENRFRRAMLLYGRSGNNGKSTLLTIVNQLAGEENISHLSLQDMEERFRPVELYGKAVNSGDDISAKILTDSSIFKKIVTGEIIMAEKKGRDPIEFKPYAKLWFACNKLPPTADNTDAFFSRITLLRLEHDFSKDADFNPDLKERQWSIEALDCLTKYAVEYFKVALDQKGFTLPQSSVEALRSYQTENDSVLAWLEESEPVLIGKQTSEAYEEYSNYCRNNGFTGILKKITFCKRVCSERNLSTKPVRDAYGNLVRWFCIKE